MTSEAYALYIRQIHVYCKPVAQVTYAQRNTSASCGTVGQRSDPGNGQRSDTVTSARDPATQACLRIGWVCESLAGVFSLENASQELFYTSKSLAYLDLYNGRKISKSPEKIVTRSLAGSLRAKACPRSQQLAAGSHSRLAAEHLHLQVPAQPAGGLVQAPADIKQTYAHR